MAELKLKQGSAEWEKYRARALSDLFWFADFVLGYGTLVPLTLPTHYLMCRFLERATGNEALDSKHYRLVSVPRGTGKTTLETVAHSIQRALRNPDTAILIANERQENANAFLAEIKQQFETNELLRALFPDKIPTDFARHQPWAATSASLLRKTTRKEPTFMTVGVGGTVTGMHFDTIVCDDAISREAMENARAGSWLTTEKVNRWINQLRPLLNFSAEHYEIVYIGTKWYMGDSYEHIERSFGYGEEPQRVVLKMKLEDGSTQTIPAYSVGDLAVFKRAIIENGACIFPEKYTLEELAKIRVADPALYAANFMNNPADDVATTFKQGWLRYFVWAAPSVVRFPTQEGKDVSLTVSDLDCLLSVDPAFSEGTGNPSRQALVVTGSTGGGEHLLLLAAATNQGLDAFVQDIVLAAKSYKPRKLLIERAGQQLAFIRLVRQALDAAGVGLPIEEVSPGGRKKEMRIQTLEPYFQRGVLLVHRDQHDFLDEYASFPRGEHKDLLDALAYQAPFWRDPMPGAAKGSSVLGAGQQRKERELAELYAKLGTNVPHLHTKFDRLVRADGSRR